MAVQPLLAPEQLELSHQEAALLNEYKDFLNKHIRYYYNNVMDKDLGLIDPKKKFSSMRDHYNRKSSMYDNSMMAMVAIEI